ncbi:MAG: ABC transporter ATP-binding protein/permease [Candidatus Kapabacteria bacterium]|nr:ABC transporter ATP-binding protein/permease [Candidatus Kapabacteria bacterium]
MSRRRSPGSEPSEALPPVSSLRAHMGFLLRYYRPYAWQALAALALMIPSSAVSLVLPSLTGDLIDSVLHTVSPEDLSSMAATMGALLLGQAVSGYVVSVTLSRITENVIATLRSDVFGHILRLPMTVFASRRVGDFTSRLSSDLALIQETFSFSILQGIRQSIFLVGSLFVIVTTSWQLTIPIVVGTPILVGVAILLGRKIRALSTATQDALAETSTIAEESLQSISSVKSFVRETFELSRYHDAIRENVRLAVKGARLRALFVTFIIFISFGGIAGVILYGANLIATGAITMGILMAFLMYAMFVAGALGSFAELFGQLQKTLGASQRIKELLDAEPEPAEQSSIVPVLTSVTVKNVTFHYPERPETVVLHDVSLSIKSGERIAFVGESGAGKSTAAALIQRFYEPSQGEVIFNDIPTSRLTLADVRRNVGVVPQDVILFGGTIFDNIRYGNLDATAEDIRQAARSANALQFIESFPEGFNTRVGDRGIKLSGGQRQRVAIARALLKNPSILILDEATSSLDAESEALIQEALERLMVQRTTIIIAHRLSTVRTCDRIYVFEKGSIAEVGTHQELLSIPNGRYAAWCSLQNVNS